MSLSVTLFCKIDLSFPGEKQQAKNVDLSNLQREKERVRREREREREKFPELKFKTNCGCKFQAL